MLDFLAGLVDAKKNSPNRLSLNVNGIGFLLYVTQRSFSAIEEGQEVRCFTVLNVGQDNVKLFGFLEEWERDFYELIVTVKGIGSKSALALVDSFAPSQFLEAITNEDPKMITGAPGIGKKTAERIVFELKTKVIEIEKIIMSSNLGSSSAGVNLSSFGDTVSTLQSLGYSASDIEKAIQANSEQKKSDELLRACLTWLSAN